VGGQDGRQPEVAPAVGGEGGLGGLHHRVHSSLAHVVSLESLCGVVSSFSRRARSSAVLRRYATRSVAPMPVATANGTSSRLRNAQLNVRSPYADAMQVAQASAAAGANARHP